MGVREYSENIKETNFPKIGRKLEKESLIFHRYVESASYTNIYVQFSADYNKHLDPREVQTCFMEDKKNHT
jgi:hypothetical protein